MSGELSRGGEFLTEQRTRIQELVAVVHGQLDFATTERNNLGGLMLPVGLENTYGAKWQTTPPELPERLEEFLPFEPGDVVEVDACYRYGVWFSLIDIQASTTDDDDDPRSFGIRLKFDNYTGVPMHVIGMGEVEEADTLAVMDAVFTDNEAYRNRPNSLDTRSAFLLGIDTQATKHGIERYTQEAACKQANNHRFQLWVRTIDRAHPTQKPSQTYITLQRQFGPENGSLQYAQQGILTQELIIEQDTADQVTAIQRRSNIEVFDTLASPQGGERILVLPSPEAAMHSLDKLFDSLYPDATPTLDDLAYFQRLLTQPLDEKDYYP